MVFVPIASGEIDKLNPRTPHIVLHTVPSLSFSTATHSFNFQLSLLTPPQDKFHRMTTVEVDAQSGHTFGSLRTPSQGSIDLANAQWLQDVDSRLSKTVDTVQNLEKSVATINTRVDKLEKSVTTINGSIKDLEKSMNERIDGLEKSMNERIDGLANEMKVVQDTLSDLKDYIMKNNHGNPLPAPPASPAPPALPAPPAPPAPPATAWTRMRAAASQGSLGTRTSGKRSLKNTKFYRNLSGIFSGFREEVNTNIDRLETSAARAAEDLEIRVEDVDDGEEPVAGPSHLYTDAQSLWSSTEQLSASPSSQVSEAQRSLLGQPILPNWR